MDTVEECQPLVEGEGPSSRYGSSSHPSSLTEDDEENPSTSDSRHSRRSLPAFHLGSTKLSKSNIWTSVRLTDSFAEFGDQYERVPTLLTDNMRLVLDENLESNEKGGFYYAESAFYDPTQEPQYVLTVNPDIYRRVLQEAGEAWLWPMGLYFCCHGGDLAHAGVAEGDFVDISVAYVLLTVVLTVLIVLSTTDDY